MGLVSGKIAVVTGGAQGIGEAISMTLAKEGASIAVIDVNLEKAQATVENIKKLGVESEAFKADVSNNAEVGGGSGQNC